MAANLSLKLHVDKKVSVSLLLIWITTHFTATYKGVADGGGGSWSARDPPLLLAFFYKKITYNRYQRRHDNVMRTLILTQCDPLPSPFGKSWLRP